MKFIKLALVLGVMFSGFVQAKTADIKTFSNGCTRTCSCASTSVYQNCAWVSNGSGFSCIGGTSSNVVVGVTGALDCSNCKTAVKPIDQKVSCFKGTVAVFDSSGNATCSVLNLKPI